MTFFDVYFKFCFANILFRIDEAALLLRARGQVLLPPGVDGNASLSRVSLGMGAQVW